MPVAVCMLRAVNVAGHNMIKMEALRALCESLNLRDAQTYVQSGNVVFRTDARDLARLARRIQDGIAKKFGLRPEVILRTSGELRSVIARNPFAKRRGIEPHRLLVTFLAAEPAAEACDAVRKIKAAPEELWLERREFYIYYPNGMARPNVPWVRIEKMLKTPGTARNWNTVQKLLEMAEKMEASE